jgi:hypothetical protein
MRGKWRRWLAGVVMAGALAVCGKLAFAQNTALFKDWKPSVLADALQEKPRAGLRDASLAHRLRDVGQHGDAGACAGQRARALPGARPDST